MLRKHLSVIVVILLLCSLSVLLFGCGTDQVKDDQKPDVAKGKEHQQADVIKLAGGDWGYPTPYAHYPRGPGSRKKALIFDTLVAVVSDTNKNVLPKLASDWQVSGDGLVYTFKLRSGVKWHDSQPFTVQRCDF